MFNFLKHPAQLVCKISVRNFSQTIVLSQTKSGSSSNLFKLRKSTGYALSKCKEALEKHSNNLEEATNWLNEQAQKEGWSKADKVKNRATQQGTLVFINDRNLNRATIVELNCETDFVARSEKFLNLSSLMALSVIQNVKTSLTKEIFSKDQLSNVSFINDASRTISDEMALAIGSLGENMSVRRAVLFNIGPKETLGWYMHGSNANPINQCHFGKYGALISMEMTEENLDYKPFEIGRQVCQHIVGLKPSTLGELPQEETEEQKESLNIDENETRLLHQEFLMKPGVRVLDFLKEQKSIVNDFVRFECGEAFETNEPL